MQTNLPFLVRIKGFIFLASRIIFIIQIGYYLIKGVSVANTHNRQIVNYYSNTERKTLGWVKIINIIFLFTSLGSIAFVFIGRGFFTHNEALLLIPSGLYTMFLFIIGFNGNRQIRLNVEFKDDDLASNLNEFKNGQSKNLKKQLIQLFDINKIYINSDLRITSISETLKTNRTYISKLINEEFKMNFNEFVNEYRIKEAKKLLLDKNNNLYTIEHIAEISGFGSVNSFTRVFKSIVGMPPGKFKDQTNDLQ
ncbi:MAG: helix-turn-helix transcriptional regulator [Draconibacterium sp.]|nr:helix-turn-helix transcriptional regulator [Draconibacterium sp.]